jgi:hypothetical protein
LFIFIHALRTITVNPFCFHLDDTVLPPSTAGDKGPGCEDVQVQKPSSDVGEIIVHEGGMINVALTSRREGAIEHDDICGLLSDCLQDVRFAILVMLRLFALQQNFNFYLLL